MDAVLTSSARDDERDHLEQAHHDICTALTILCSNLELVRIRLRTTTLPDGGIPVRAHLDEVEGATIRLLALAREIKVWRDGIARDAPEGAPGQAPASPKADPHG